MSDFCSISSVSHLYKTYALADSIAPFGGKLHILLVDGNINNIDNPPKNVNFFSLNDLKGETAKKIISKYSVYKDKLRWALKPVFLIYLLQNNPKVIYVDNDIFFFNDFSFLFDKLDTKAILLTPHFYETNTEKNQNWLEANFRVGLYNAGFMGVNLDAIPALDWWANCCLYNVKKSYWRGLFDDQKYLDLVPVLFDNVEIIKHRGCNFAGWNYINHPFSSSKNTNDLIFIHFAELTLIEFSKLANPWHSTYTEYIDSLKKHHSDFIFKRKLFRQNTIKNYLYYLKWKFYRLFEKN